MSIQHGCAATSYGAPMPVKIVRVFHAMINLRNVCSVHRSALKGKINAPESGPPRAMDIIK